MRRRNGDRKSGRNRSGRFPRQLAPRCDVTASQPTPQKKPGPTSPVFLLFEKDSRRNSTNHRYWASSASSHKPCQCDLRLRLAGVNSAIVVASGVLNSTLIYVCAQSIPGRCPCPSKVSGRVSQFPTMTAVAVIHSNQYSQLRLSPESRLVGVAKLTLGTKLPNLYLPFSQKI